jgi:hypothetical protein
VKIQHTDFDAQYPWPEGTFLQGGSSGLVIRPQSKGGNYGTAFVEAFPEGTFIRGEGATVPEAETACWEKYQRYENCPGPNGHEYVPHNKGGHVYRNGGGFCKHCWRFAAQVFTPEQLGLHCKTCGTPTFWSQIGNDMYCEQHANDPDTIALKRARLEAARGTEETVTGSALGDMFARLAEEITEGKENR